MMATRTARSPKFDRRKDGTILWPSVEIEPTPDLIEMSRKAVAARRAWRAVYAATRHDPLSRETRRALNAATAEQARVLCSFRWEMYAAVGKHWRSFYVDAAGENESPRWFEGGQAAVKERFHWFIDGDRCGYDYGRTCFIPPE
jgi:hypothetical protein